MCEYDKKYELQNSLDLSSGGQEAGDDQVVVHFSPFIQYSSDHKIEEYFIFISRVFVQLNKAKY